ncbi:choice-of-anchor H family protein [Shewanella algae]|uniref:choice-of-anchor H family protein n=1 Tax=Shewanella algae TaxID=38313 RepID=UPI0031F5CD6E
MKLLSYTVFSLSLFLALFWGAPAAYAKEPVGGQASIGQKAQQPNEEQDSPGAELRAAQHRQLLKQLQQEWQSTGVQVSGERMTREQMIAKKQKLPESQAAPQRMVSMAAHSYYHEFSFYEAASYLYDDYDSDGFYRSFAVRFDADVYGNDPAESVPVYAELYLSRNGGDWEHYYSTEVFYIQGDSTQDDFEVLTTLESGYPSDHYDVLIDLYEPGYTDIVATISSYESNSLYALPLESREWDRDDGATVIVDAGGSLSVVALVSLVLLGGLRYRRGQVAP